ncbi:SLC42A [Lepeophtheirus salmonis]|uniref:SLC42A n=1 Tax=Lepeophtheirus salmonis TaxID=72036 RepID=A0A7R8H8X6_LEPSM|nr:SLC42A [Lepeophtheirus salmonis]CAF2947256.1 SLC42A [Lepeophtheirus salmonis]
MWSGSVSLVNIQSDVDPHCSTVLNGNCHKFHYNLFCEHGANNFLVPGLYNFLGGTTKSGHKKKQHTQRCGLYEQTGHHVEDSIYIMMKTKKKKPTDIAIIIIVLQVVFIILFGIFVVYNPENAIVGSPQGEGLQVYPMFQDVSVMIFIGFGFLMSFLKKYGLSAVSLSFLLSVLCVEWGTLVIGFFHLHHGKIYLDLAGMLNSEFAAATILISFGVVIGKTTPLQLIVMVLIEMVLFVVNEVIGRNMIRAIDAGDTIFVHLFGAYFGVACSFALQDKRVANHENQASRYNSDLFSMVAHSIEPS